MRYNQYVAGFIAALVLALPAASFAQTNPATQSQLTALLQQLTTLLQQISALQAATAPTTQTSRPSCTALAGTHADGSVVDACVVNRFLACNESSLKTQVRCAAGQWQSTQTSPAMPPGISTSGCLRMTDVQTTSGNNFCGDLYCPDNPPAKRYWCRAGKNPAAWYSSALPCTGLSCTI